MIKINKDERREFFRINDEVHLDFKPISEDEYKQAPETLKNLHDSAFSLSANFATLNNNIHPVLNNIKQLYPDVGDYLDMLNSKIDDLSQHVLYNETDYDKKNIITANLSASGIQFSTDKSFDVQQPIKMELVLLPEKIGVLIFGRIIEVKTENISIEFEFLRPEDQELMIKHNLNKQMEELRKKNDHD
jgi:PilZ domain-containing protein